MFETHCFYVFHTLFFKSSFWTTVSIYSPSMSLYICVPFSVMKSRSINFWIIKIDQNSGHNIRNITPCLKYLYLIKITPLIYYFENKFIQRSSYSSPFCFLSDFYPLNFFLSFKFYFQFFSDIAVCFLKFSVFFLVLCVVYLLERMWFTLQIQWAWNLF